MTPSPADPKGLRAYVQHKDRCAVSVCSACRHTLGVHGGRFKAGEGYQQICASFSPKPCTCGLDAILALDAATPREQEKQEDDTRVDGPSDARP